MNDAPALGTVFRVNHEWRVRAGKLHYVFPRYAEVTVACVRGYRPGGIFVVVPKEYFFAKKEYLIRQNHKGEWWEL